jgi:hypothetical protein
MPGRNLKIAAVALTFGVIGLLISTTAEENSQRSWTRGVQSPTEDSLDAVGTSGSVVTRRRTDIPHESPGSQPLVGTYEVPRGFDSIQLTGLFVRNDPEVIRAPVEANPDGQILSASLPPSATRESRWLLEGPGIASVALDVREREGGGWEVLDVPLIPARRIGVRVVDSKGRGVPCVIVFSRDADPRLARAGHTVDNGAGFVIRSDAGGRGSSARPVPFGSWRLVSQTAGVVLKEAEALVGADSVEMMLTATSPPVVRGRVLDAATHSPLAGVYVSPRDSKTEQMIASQDVTDGLGRFAIHASSLDPDPSVSLVVTDPRFESAHVASTWGETDVLLLLQRKPVLLLRVVREDGRAVSRGELQKGEGDTWVDGRSGDDGLWRIPHDASGVIRNLCG